MILVLFILTMLVVIIYNPIVHNLFMIISLRRFDFFTWSRYLMRFLIRWGFPGMPSEAPSSNLLYGMQLVVVRVIELRSPPLVGASRAEWLRWVLLLHALSLLAGGVSRRLQVMGLPIQRRVSGGCCAFLSLHRCVIHGLSRCQVVLLLLNWVLGVLPVTCKHHERQGRVVVVHYNRGRLLSLLWQFGTASCVLS